VSAQNGGTSIFYSIKDLPAFSPVDGIKMQAIMGEKMMANWVWLEPNTEMPEHEHPHEQIGAVLEGELELTTPDEARVVKPGEAYIVPGNVRHKGVAGPEGCLVLDIFSPPREEYASMARGEG
jgi:quercetin dioxygenase-like cupin family protein